jgi:hypothetical protein
MRQRKFSTTWSAFSDLVSLAVESQQVIALRLARMALGGARGRKETRRMIVEKAVAAATATAAAAKSFPRGGSPAALKKVQSTYRRAVRANRRRLMRPGS